MEEGVPVEEYDVVAFYLDDLLCFLTEELQSEGSEVCLKKEGSTAWKELGRLLISCNLERCRFLYFLCIFW